MRVHKLTLCRRASEESILAVQIFDQKKFKKKDQGFLGVINVRVGDVVDFGSGQDRESSTIGTPSHLQKEQCSLR